MSQNQKVTPQDVDNAIVRHEFFVTGTLTICVLFLKNGFTVTGESACSNPAIFNSALGEELAYENAKRKIWPLLGYALRDRLNKIEQAPKMSGHISDLPGASTYLGTRVIHTAPMSRREYNSLRGWTVPRDENPDDEGYLVEYTDGGKPNVEGFTGYVSWSPKGVFDRAYSANPEASTPGRQGQVDLMRETFPASDPVVAGLPVVHTTGLTFGSAIEALKSGKKAARVGWNGKGMWLSLSVPGDVNYSVIPASAFWSDNNREYAEKNGGHALVLPTITMKTASGEILIGWLASQTDMLAEDWMLVD